MIKINQIPLRKIIRVDVDVINSPTSPDLFFWKTKLLTMVQLGRPIALIGACRTGKTLLLNALTQNIIDKRAEAMHTSQRKGLPLNLSEIPDGVFRIDDCQFIDPQSLEKILPVMGVCTILKQYWMNCQSSRKSRKPSQRIISIMSNKSMG